METGLYAYDYGGARVEPRRGEMFVESPLAGLPADGYPVAATNMAPLRGLGRKKVRNSSRALFFFIQLVRTTPRASRDNVGLQGEPRRGEMFVEYEDREQAKAPKGRL